MWGGACLQGQAGPQRTRSLWQWAWQDRILQHSNRPARPRPRPRPIFWSQTGLVRSTVLDHITGIKGLVDRALKNWYLVMEQLTFDKYTCTTLQVTLKRPLICTRTEKRRVTIKRVCLSLLMPSARLTLVASVNSVNIILSHLISGRVAARP